MFDADDMTTTTTVAILRLSLVVLLLHIGVAVFAVAQSGPSVETAVQTVRIENLTERVRRIEDANLDGRLRTVESDMVEVKWLSRGVTAAIIGHLVATILGISGKRRSS